MGENKKPKSITLNIKIPEGWSDEQIEEFMEKVSNSLNVMGGMEILNDEDTSIQEMEEAANPRT